MAPHTITPALGVVCRYKAKAGLRRSPRGLHTRTQLSSLLILNLDLSLKTTCLHFTVVQFPEVGGTTSNRGVDGRALKATHVMGATITNVLQPGSFVWFEKEQELLVKAADETVSCTGAFFMMWWSSRRLVCRGRPEPGFRVDDISRIHWSQNLPATQPERPN
ncbi:uncharacterized protein TNCV_57981 [Trichonephila clavipes]|nr:uncharacterized protein TNCV_57981 [Trichonephila clavipes]